MNQPDPKLVAAILGLGVLAGLLRWLWEIVTLMCEDCPHDDR